VPCNTIQRSKVEFLAGSTDVALLTEALRSLGYSSVMLRGEALAFETQRGPGSYSTKTGQLILPESCDVNDIKRAYSVAVVQSQAYKHGWKIAWSINAQGRRQASVQRRG
jgi:hypothetical protein